MQLGSSWCQLFWDLFLLWLCLRKVVSRRWFRVIKVVKENDWLFVSEVVSLERKLTHAIDYDALLRDPCRSYIGCFAGFFLNLAVL